MAEPQSPSGSRKAFGVPTRKTPIRLPGNTRKVKSEFAWLAYAQRIGLADDDENQKSNFSTLFACQAVGITEVHDDIWLVSFMEYDLGYFDLETRVLEPLENPFGPKVLPM